jgi:hypothetical protein
MHYRIRHGTHDLRNLSKQNCGEAGRLFPYRHSNLSLERHFDPTRTGDSTHPDIQHFLISWLFGSNSCRPLV